MHPSSNCEVDAGDQALRRAVTHADSARVQSAHGWLPAVLPADAHTFRIAQPDLAASLVEAGAVLTETAPDVEITDAGADLDSARFMIVTIQDAQDEGGGLPRRAARRLRGSVRVRATASRVRRRLRSGGWAQSSTVLWDVEQPIRLPGARHDLRELRPAEVLPQRAIVTAWRGRRPLSLLDAIAKEASEAIQDTIVPRRALARAGLTVVLSDAHVLRLALGPGQHKLELLETGLEALRAGAPPAVVERTVPWILARGKTGVVDWTVEPRLAGAPSGARLGGEMLRECVEFLVELHRFGRETDRRSILEDAEVVAAACSEPAHAALVRELGHRLEDELAGLPRGFGHGDFWSANVLVDRGRLRGVVDWDNSAPDRLPAIDLLHLLLTARRQRTREYIGEGVAGHHLAWARAGGNAVVHEYASELGLALSPRRLEALVLAYWLDRIGFELRVFADRTARPVWMRNNIARVLEAL